MLLDVGTTRTTVSCPTLAPSIRHAIGTAGVLAVPLLDAGTVGIIP